MKERMSMYQLPREMFGHRLTYHQEIRFLHYFNNFDIEKAKKLILQIQQTESSKVMYYSNYVKNLIVFIDILSMRCLQHGCEIEDIEKVKNKYLTLVLSESAIDQVELLHPIEQKMIDEFYDLFSRSTKYSHPLVMKAIKLITSRINEDLKVSQVSKDLGYSESHVSAVFKKNYGITIEHFILDTKIRYAQLYLISTTMSIQEVSLILNFSSLAYFNKVFKKVAKITPKHFRSLTA